MDAWTRLCAALDELAAHAPAPPRGGRIGAALALLRDPGDGDLELLLTRRRDDLSHHPGQISFPGGRVDPGESIDEAAVREAHEECGLDPASLTLLGRLPAFYIPPSRYWLQVVIGRWDRAHPLVAEEAEVAEILHVRLSQLMDSERWRAVRLSARGESWAWQLDDGHVLWGATAIVTAVLVGLIEPGWNGGIQPADLIDEHELRPWERSEPGVPRPGPPRVPGIAELPVDRVVEAEVPATGEPEEAIQAGRITAQVVESLLPPAEGGSATGEGAQVAGGGSATGEGAQVAGGGSATILVLCGFGRTGTVGAAAAVELVKWGLDVRVVVPRPTEPLHPQTRPLLDGIADRVTVHDGSLPAAAITIDALAGKGLDGPLREPLVDIVMDLRHHAMPVVSVDLPSGLHPVEGLVGDAVAADVTLALGSPAPGVFGSGLGPFVGDLYLIPTVAGGQADEDPIVRIVPGPDIGGWRE